MARETRARGGHPLCAPILYVAERVELDGGVALTFELNEAMRLRSEQNLREHWAETGRRAKCHRDRIGFALAWLMPAPLVGLERYAVTLVRLIGPRGQRFDSDGVVSACKHVRDGVADAIGIDDRRDDRVAFSYAQERHAAHGVRVIVRRA